MLGIKKWNAFSDYRVFRPNSQLVKNVCYTLVVRLFLGMVMMAWRSNVMILDWRLVIPSKYFFKGQVQNEKKCCNLLVGTNYTRTFKFAEYYICKSVCTTAHD